jgi:macrophage erythroblast attacher
LGTYMSLCEVENPGSKACVSFNGSELLRRRAETETAELQRAMACLAFKGDTACQPYAQLFSHTAWDELVESFTRENHALNALPGDSLLTAHLQAGLSALKVAHVPRGSANASREDPLHVPAFQRMSDALPFAKHTHSKLVCHVTRRIMDEDNPPMVLPNGFVYSSGAMEAMAAGAGGKVSCPRTGQGPYKLSELQKAFLA